MTTRLPVSVRSCEPASAGASTTTDVFPDPKKYGPPACTMRFTVNLQVSGSTSDASVRIVMVGSMGKSDSDFFDELGCVAITYGPQVGEGVDAGAVPVAPADLDGVVVDAGGTGATKPRVPGVQVATAPIVPERGQRPRISSQNRPRSSVNPTAEQRSQPRLALPHSTPRSTRAFSGPWSADLGLDPRGQ